MTTIAQLITRHDGRIAPDATLADAARLMLGERISSIIVVDRNSVAGIVTESDMLHAMRAHRALDRPVSEIMTSPVHSVTAGTDFRLAYRTAARLGIRHIVVTDDDGQAIGVASETEFRQHLGADFYRHLNNVDVLMEQMFPRLPPDASLDSALAVMEAARASCIVVVEDRRPLGILTERDVVRLFLRAEDNPSVAEVMTRPAITVAEHDSLATAAELMRHRGIRHLVAVDAAGHAVGLLSEHTLMRPLELDVVDEMVQERLLSQKKSDEALLLRNAALAGLIRGEPLKGVLDLIALSAEAELPTWRCSVMIANEAGDTLYVGAAPRLPDTYARAIDGIAIGDSAGSCGTAASRRQRVVVEDIFSSPLWSGFHELARIGGFAACWSEPILSPTGDLLGTFAAYHATPAAPDEGQLELLSQACQLTALVLTHARSTRQLHESQNTFRGILDSISEAVIILGPDGRFLDVNIEAERMSGHPRATLIGGHYSDFGAEHMNDLTTVDRQIATAFNGEPQRLEYWAQAADRRRFPVEVRLTPGHYFGRPVIIASITDITVRKLDQLRLETERELAQALSTGLDREGVLQALVDAALRYPELDAGCLYGRQADRAYELLAHAGLSPAFVTASHHLAPASRAARLIRSGQPIAGGRDEQGQPTGEYLLDSSLTAAEGLLGVIALPIVADGAAIACLYLGSRQDAQLSSDTLHALKALSSHFAHTLSRLQAREDTQRHQHNLSGLFDTLDDFIFVFDGEGCILHYNRAVSDRLGYSPDSLLGRSFAEIRPEGLRQTALQMADEILSGQRSTCQLPLLRADGSTLMADTRITRGYWNDLPAWFAIAQDITQRLADEERQRLAASVFDNAHEGIMITDPGGRIVEVNATFTELTGYTREEALGQNAGMLNSGHHKTEFYQEMWQAIHEIGYWRGEVWNRKKSGEIFVEQLTISTVRGHSGDISHFVGIFSDITLLKQHQQRLEHLAHFDALTQLPNRMLLGDRLQLAMAQSQRNRRLLAVCYLDLDGFKPVNDRYGHAVGDRLLIEVAQRLKGCVRGGDTVSRLGGDEFVMLFAELGDLHESEHAVARVIATLARPFQVSDHSISISASVGVTLYPHDGADADTLLRHADQAMYIAKQSGRNRFHLFDPESDRRARCRRETLQHIGDGLLRGEFVLHYQPKVDMRAGRVIGAEALIRWQHAERGLLLPQHFLPVTEGSELALTLGEWVIAESLAQLARWNAQGLETRVSINISGEHLQHPGFAERLAELLSAQPTVNPRQLELEVLETAALEDIGKVAGLISACRALGVHFALDDFGTGYSSLTYFRRLPADTLKIDQSFIRDMLEDPEDLAIVEGVVGLTQAFHRQVIAEGVETPEHGLILLLLGCDQAQGFGIARPMPARELPAWIAQFRPDPAWQSAIRQGLSREDLPMLVAGFEHKRWIKALRDYLANNDDQLPQSQRDVHDCSFGRWYYGPDSQRYATQAGFAELETTHSTLHDIGCQLLDLHQAGERDAAAALLPTLENTSRELLETLQRIRTAALHPPQTNAR